MARQHIINGDEEDHDLATILKALGDPEPWQVYVQYRSCGSHEILFTVEED